MNEIEKVLKERKAELEKIEAPAEMESLLKQALKNKRRRKRYRPVAAILIAVLIFTYNFDVLAYYGKKFTGYDQITIGALSKLNEEGKGQEIGESRSFSNGTTVTIDGIMFDDNQLVVFYKMQCSSGKLMEVLEWNLPRLHINGLNPRGYYSTGGQGKNVDDQTLNFVDTMESPMFYEKWLSIDIHMMVNGVAEIQSVNFTLDRNRAMERTARLELNAETVIGDCRIVFDELTASTMSSMLKGRIVPQSDEALERFDPRSAEGSMVVPHLVYDIVSDEGEVMQFSGGQSASGGNITFTGKGDALPKDFKTLQIKNIRIDTMKLVDKAVVVNAEIKAMQVSEDMIINSVYRDGEDLCVSVSSRGIPVMGLFRGEQQLEEINIEQFELEAKSVEPVERVFRFKASVEGEEDASTVSNDNTSSEESEGDTVAESIGNGTDSLELHVKFIRYTDISPDTIDIPVD